MYRGGQLHAVEHGKREEAGSRLVSSKLLVYCYDITPWPRQLRNKVFKFGAYSFTSWKRPWKQAGRQAWHGSSSWELTCWDTATKEREVAENGISLQKPQSPLLWHTSSGKATFPNPSQTEPSVKAWVCGSLFYVLPQLEFEMVHSRKALRSEGEEIGSFLLGQHVSQPEAHTVTSWLLSSVPFPGDRT